MKKFICSNAIWLTSLLAVIGLVAALACDSLSTTQSCVLLWFFFITLHGWEEYRIPGGFTQMMFDNLGVNIADPNSGHLVVQKITYREYAANAKKGHVCPDKRQVRR